MSSFRAFVELSSVRSRCMNKRTLLTVIVPVKGLDSLLPRFRVEVEILLFALRLPVTALKAEMRAMSQIEIGLASNPDVLRCLSEAIRALHGQPTERGRDTLQDAAVRLASKTYATTNYLQPVVLATSLFMVTEGTGRRPTERARGAARPSACRSRRESGGAERRASLTLANTTGWLQGWIAFG